MDQIVIYFKGISEFYYFAIPAILGVAAVIWLWFFSDLHIFRRTLSQEERRAIAVGVKKPLRAPIKITFSDKKDASVRVVEADLEGEYCWVIYKNFSATTATNIHYTWNQISPDGIIVKSSNGWASPDVLAAGQQAEMKLRLYESDPRMATFDIRMSHEW